MSTPRLTIAALCAGIAMYFWASLAHTVLPLSTIGVSQITSNEPAVLEAIRNSLGSTPGFYIFPSVGWRPGDTSAQRADAMKNYDAKLAVFPSGILIYNPPGAHGLTPKQLIVEFLAELLEAALAVILMSLTRITSVSGRIAFVAFIGILAALTTNVSYWNWYSFPGSYTLSYMTSQIIGFVIAGIVAALILKGTASPSTLPKQFD
jgi:hypothetical protein